MVVRPQDYSGFGLKPQKPTPKWAQLASRAPARAELKRVSSGASALQGLVRIVHDPQEKALDYSGFG